MKNAYLRFGWLAYLPHEKMLRSIELLGTGVAPIVRKHLTSVLSHGVF